ncbi:E3 ubiquitin-protein ligase AIRP2-like isoform X1 [Lotus japonicus]|uniref:E3 ubiquitin-protein ligase AIRP2-like isoform X1 n=2 Tax=Lotus japonicus TaxID=34305 RepID=UPI0025872ADE|nr:E3 ubiquitin-protein ligase AIRP2-like isoform X1 [Lotus japonicus]
MLRYHILDSTPTFQDSLKALEADIQHANLLAASISRGNGSACLQMKLVYNKLAPVFLFLYQWMDFSCSCLLPSHFNLFRVIVYKIHTNGKPNTYSYGRKATIREFYGVILPSLQRLHDDLVDTNIMKEKDRSIEVVIDRSADDRRKPFDLDSDRENECGICLESCTKMVLPNCCHAMCKNCYSDWNTRSESCPFCRGSLKRVNSGDLWVLTSSSDVIDAQTAYREDILCLYLFVNNLPEHIPDALFFMYYEYLF